MSLLRVARRTAPSLFVAFVVLSCGSRTGLFGPDGINNITVDASIDVTVPFPDASRDARVDAPIDAPDDGPLVCQPGTFGFQPATPQIMFVLDRSGSMNYELGADVEASPGFPSRWTSLRSALSQAIVPFDQQIAMGAKFFPEANADPFDAVNACITVDGVGISPGLGHAQSIINVFDTTEPVGGTPTNAALVQAAEFLAASRTVSRAMVLATDGAPNCNGALDHNTCVCTAATTQQCRVDDEGAYNCLDDVATIASLQNIFGVRKIPVFVIGLGGASFTNVLDAMAVAGGRPRAASPKYYPATTTADLNAAFAAVRDSVAKCTYITPSAPQDPNNIEVVVANGSIPRDPTHTEGWDWIDQAYGQLQLFGTACDTASPTNVSGTITCTNDE